MLFRIKTVFKVFGKEFTFERGSTEATIEIVKLAGTALTIGIDLTVWVKL